ncbi:hypothetical protein ACIBBD_27285 [Streptomyces sp. NPDC051315]|uniref:hypothetical protein n=1 Tax=Streptomyces sp. NPDC051315 TaxID=3365650 RepID=UPI00379DDACF
MTEQTQQTEPEWQPEQPVVPPPLPAAPGGKPGRPQGRAGEPRGEGEAVQSQEQARESQERVPSKPSKDRRVLRAVLRWTAAAVVFATVGTATAYGITRMERTDVPGLETVSDGRWEYPPLTRPPLPSGSPGPFADGNTAGAHHADLRALLLPAPLGATEDKALRGSDGWLAQKDFLAEYQERQDREEFGQKLVDAGLRHIAARGWTTKDGTHTRVYLLRFATAEVADRMRADIAPFDEAWYQVRGADASHLDADFPVKAGVEGVQRSAYVEDRPYGAEQVRHAYLQAGDVLALVVQTRKGAAPAVPFQQTVTLQSQLLG